MAPVIEFLQNILRFHKMKIVWFLAFSLGFTVLFFPFEDLSDKVTGWVSEGTQNTVYLQFDDMSFTLMPLPGIKMHNVMIEAPPASDIAVESLSVSPKLLALLKMRPYVNVSGEGLFAGNLDLGLSSSSKLKIPEAISADLEFENFNLRLLLKALENQLRLPFTADGIGNLNAEVDFDPTMKSQPDGNLDLLVQKVQLPSFTASTPSGPIPVPGFNFEKLSLKGKIKDGKVTLAETLLGTPKDELSAKITGEVDVRIFPGGSTSVTYYNLAIDMNVKDSAKNKLGVMMAMVDGMLGSYSSSSISGKRYAFRIQGRPTDPMPTFAPF